jgi:hypothetical protein
MTYARLTEDLLGIERLNAISDAEFAVLAAAFNPKTARFRLQVDDALPTPLPTQKIVSTGYVIELNQIRQTWALVDKTADELEADALSEEAQQVTGYIADIQAQLDVSNADRALLTNAQRINELEKDTRVTMRAAKWLLRQAKRSS